MPRLCHELERGIVGVLEEVLGHLQLHRRRQLALGHQGHPVAEEDRPRHRRADDEDVPAPQTGLFRQLRQPLRKRAGVGRDHRPLADDRGLPPREADGAKRAVDADGDDLKLGGVEKCHDLLSDSLQLQ